MSRAILGREELYRKIIQIVDHVLGRDVVGVIVFGSTVYIGWGEDVDIIIIVDREISEKEKLKLELEISRELRKVARDLTFDIHVMSMSDFEKNLTPGSFLTGLALGYEVLLDRADIEDKILSFLQKVSEEKYILHNKYGTWNLGHHARITLRLKKTAKTGSTQQST